MRRKVKTLILVLALGLMSWSLVHILTNRRPVEFQEVGLIIAADRVVPTHIYLRPDRPARLHLANVSGKKRVVVSIPVGEGMKVGVETGRVTAVELTRSNVRELNERLLTVSELPGRSLFRVIEPDPEGNGAAKSQASETEIAVVMTDVCAAPQSITLKKGVSVKLWVTKTASEVPFDRFTCDELGIRIQVADGEVTMVSLKPETAGEFVFTGTVTPDSRVVVHVVD